MEATEHVFSFQDSLWSTGTTIYWILLHENKGYCSKVGTM